MSRLLAFLLRSLLRTLLAGATRKKPKRRRAQRKPQYPYLGDTGYGWDWRK